MCTLCSRKYSSSKTFEKHIRRCQDKRKLACPECHKEVIGQVQLDDHRRYSKFHGPSIKYILREETLIDIEAHLPDQEYARALTDYLRSVRNLHAMCTAKEL